MRLLVNHTQGKIYIDIITYKHELRFEYELGTHVIVCP